MFTMKTSPSWLKFLVIGLLVLGIVLRLTNLDLRPYWYDETYTSLQLSGYDDPEIRAEVEGKIITAQDLAKYQYPSPDKSVSNTVALIAKKEPQLTPLYFILLRFWVQLFGHSVLITRSFSALLSIMVIAAMYWLCRQLFVSQTTPWIAVSLVAISPFHLLYAQEARPVIMWALTTLLSHIALWRAIRQPTATNWIIFTLATILNLYTYLFSVLVLLGQGIYLLVQERGRLSKRLIAFAISSVVSMFCFVPWMLVFVPNLSKANQGNSPSILKAPFLYLARWLRNIGLLFADFSVGEQGTKIVLILYLVIILIFTALVFYAIYFLCTTTERSIWLFIVTAIVVPFLPLILKDLISSGGSSMVTRYLVPTWLGVQIAVAHLLSSKIEQRTTPYIFWLGGLFFVLSLGTMSSLLMSTSQLWWNKAEANLDLQLAKQVINQAKNPLLVTDSYLAFPLSLSHSLSPQVQFLLIPAKTFPKLPSNQNIFLYRPSAELLNSVQKEHTIEPITPSNPYNPGGDIKEQRLFHIVK